ncbi:unnamed protein product [Linum trigynum]|uniref:protein-serine/threonine phosphatase n=1 Tax=Linum trigynum TaxID=586398 RepID=A0AAV2DLF7_9ROSI
MCSVAVPVPKSPIFASPRMQSIFCKPCPSPSSIHSPRSTAVVSSSPRLSLSSSSSPPTSMLSLRVNEAAGNPGAVLKRKRPARIDIPVATRSLGLCLETPRLAEEERSDVVEVEGDGYSVYCKRGRRGSMEDRYAASVNASDSKQAMFGIFDGHGGARAAEFASKNLGENISAELSSSSRSDDNGFQEAIRKAYLKTDADFLNENAHGGACCVTALIQDGNLVVSNAGDCRAVMSRGGVAEALTSDHQASRPDEKERIEALGGYVDCCRGVWRIQGSLAVTRGIGDGHLKEFVIAEPETKVVRIEPDCEFLILASDGLWDKVSNQEALDLIRHLCTDAEKPKPALACNQLAELAVRRGSMDDISVMIVQLARFLH